MYRFLFLGAMLACASSSFADEQPTAMNELTLLQGDVDAGEAVFKKCKSCHAVGDDAKNRAGPVLNGVFGALVGQVEDFKYSSAMQKAANAGLVWDTENLTAYLTKPKAFLKGTRMAFPGLKNPEDIEDLLAYLATFDQK